MTVPPRRALNPDEVISEADVPGYYVNGQFIAETDGAAAKLTDAQKVNGRGIARMIKYADGRVQTWLRNEGQDPRQFGTQIAQTTDPEIQKDFDARVDAANKRAEAEAPDRQSPAAQRTAREEAEIAANAALPPDQDPRAETNADRAARGERVRKEQGAAATAAEQTTYERGRQAEADQRARDAAARTAAQENRPHVTLTQDGTQAVITYPDGRVDTRPTGLTKPPDKATVLKGAGPKGEDMQLVPDPVTGRLSLEPLPGAQVPSENLPVPAGAPKFTPDYTQDDLGLTQYNEQLLQAARSNVITQEQGRALLTQATGLAQQTATHGTTRRTQASTQRSQDITLRGQDIGEVESRRSFQGTGFDTALREIGSNARYLGAGQGGLAADAFREALGLRQRYAASAGGFRDVAPIGPVSGYLESLRGATQIGVDPGGGVSVSPPGTVPANAIGLGAIGDQPAPGGPPSGADVGAQNAATQAQSQAAFGALGIPPGPPPASDVMLTAGEPGGPPLAPGPVYAPPTAGEPGGPPLGAGAVYEPPAPPAGPPARDDWRNAPSAGGTPPYNDDPALGPVGRALPAYLQPVASPSWSPDGVMGQLRTQGYSEDELAEAMRLAGLG